MQTNLRIKPKLLREYQQKYSADSDSKLNYLKNVAKDPGYLTLDQLHEICVWKSKRRPELSLKNPQKLVKEITSFAFKAKCEESKIGSLMILEGVNFPTASVILHFCVDKTYPILDFRALWSLGIEKPSSYTFNFWKKYTECCRETAKNHGLSVRELDQALWEYSRQHQNA